MNFEDTPARQWPAAMVNITNRCTLRCRHCFVFRDGNPTDTKHEMDTETMVKRLGELQKRHGIQTMLWMGGEPLIRQDVLREGTKLFARNNVTTNGTIDLIDLPRCIYVVSIDGPQEINDAIRGKGSFRRVMKTLSRVPDSFGPTVMCQCVVTRENEDDSSLTWGSLERRDKAVREAMRLKELYPDFIWNRHHALELTLAHNAKTVTDNCYAKEFVMPLYLDGDRFTHTFCCMGNDVDCDLCGSWVVFNLAARIETNDVQDYVRDQISGID